MADVFCTQEDLEIALGGADVLVMLADYDRDGVADADVVTDYIGGAARPIRGIVAVRFGGVTSLDDDSLGILQDINKWLAAERAWLQGGRGEAVPDRIADQVRVARGDLEAIRRGEMLLGRTAAGSDPALAHEVGVLDYDPRSEGFSIANFKRGFR